MNSEMAYELQSGPYELQIGRWIPERPLWNLKWFMNSGAAPAAPMKSKMVYELQSGADEF
jgi:hypothetical protein